jgi:ribosomal protein L2
MTVVSRNKLLVGKIANLSGRSSNGHIVSYYRGNRVPRRYRLIDFGRRL